MATATKPLIVDADAHVNPSHDMWVDYLPANLREHAPQIEHGEDCDYIVFEGKRRKLLEDANALVDKDKQRLPIVAVGSAWAMQKDKVTIKARVDEDTLAMNIKPAK